MATEGAIGTSSVRRGLLRIPGTAMVMDSQNTLKIAVVRQLYCCLLYQNMSRRFADMIADGT